MQIVNSTHWATEPIIFTSIIAAVAVLIALFKGKKKQNSKLLNAGLKGDLETFKKELKKKNADVNAVNLNGYTPLIIATLKFGQKYVIEELLNKGALIDWQDISGNTALHYAVERNKKALVKLFIERGANINLVNELDEKPNDIALKSSKKELIEIIKNSNL